MKLAPATSCMKACALKYAIVVGAGGTSNERYHNLRPGFVCAHQAPDCMVLGEAGLHCMLGRARLRVAVCIALQARAGGTL